MITIKIKLCMKNIFTAIDSYWNSESEYSSLIELPVDMQIHSTEYILYILYTYTVNSWAIFKTILNDPKNDTVYFIYLRNGIM